MSELARKLQERGWTLAVAESLTGGLLTDTAARLPNAGSWLRGGLVAYSPGVKRDLLGIGDAPVVSRAAASAMASNVTNLLGADVGLAVTGVGGPGPEDGVPAGTVWIGLAIDGVATAQLLELPGDPKAIVEATCELAFDALIAALAGPSVLNRHGPGSSW